MNSTSPSSRLVSKPGEVAGLLDGRAAGAFDVGAHRFGDDVGQGGLAQAGRAAQEDVIERLRRAAWRLARRFRAAP